MRSLFILIVLILVFVVCESVYHLPIQNNSDSKLMVLVNYSYPDTSITNAEIGEIVEPNGKGSLRMISRWRNVIERKGAITVFIAEWKEFHYLKDDPSDLNILGRMILTTEKLDSLDWVIEYPFGNSK